MPYGFRHDEELDRDTNRWMLWGVVFLAAMVLAFPFYRWFEPANREDARETVQQSLAAQGQDLYSLNCASCHGLNGEGGIGPALNSKEFLQASTDEQTQLLIAVGVPGSQMNAYSLDYGGPLTSEQIKALATFMRTREEDAPSSPDWREGMSS